MPSRPARASCGCPVGKTSIDAGYARVGVLHGCTQSALSDRSFVGSARCSCMRSTLPPHQGAIRTTAPGLARPARCRCWTRRNSGGQCHCTTAAGADQRRCLHRIAGRGRQSARVAQHGLPARHRFEARPNGSAGHPGDHDRAHDTHTHLHQPGQMARHCAAAARNQCSRQHRHSAA